MAERLARELAVLDALNAYKKEPFEGEVWRIVREGRDPLEGYPAKARWDPGTFDVIYTSLDRRGALEEIHFHLSRQPVFPSTLTSVLHRIEVRASATLRFADLGELLALGVSADTFAGLDYRQTQEIGDAAAFLGFDSILAPSARWRCHNLVVFTERFADDDLRIVASEVVDWVAWRAERRDLRDGEA